MIKQLEKEAEEDEEIYEKLACWCHTNDKEKTQHPVPSIECNGLRLLQCLARLKSE